MLVKASSQKAVLLLLGDFCGTCFWNPTTKLVKKVGSISRPDAQVLTNRLS